MQKYRFSVKVNCNLADNISISDTVQDFEQIYEDFGFIILPDDYTENGTPTKWVINCHGAGGTVTTNDSQVEHQEITKYLVANGYAVMDVNGLPEKYAQERDIDLRNNVGTPIAVRCYVKAYFYCMEHFNLRREVFVHGGSMGGISSTNLVLSGCIPVIAHSAFCPVLDTYNQIFLNPWTNGAPKFALAKIFGFEKDENGEYIYDESKLIGFNPVNNHKAYTYPVPLKFWHCADDHKVEYAVTKKYIEKLRANGCDATLRSFSYGQHEPQLVGEPIKNPCGNINYGDEVLQIRPAVEEVFIWIRNFG